MTEPPRSARIVLAVGVAAGLANLVSLPLLRPEQVGLATEVYTTAAEAALAGEPVYGVSPPGTSGLHFVYPPVVLLAVLPYGLIGDPTISFAVQTTVTVAAGLLLARLLLGVVADAGVSLTRLDRTLVVGFVLLSSHSAPTLVNGQLNVVLGLLVAVGFLSVARERQWLGGTALALAATVKLFPAAFGCYLLARRRWRAVAAATLTGLGLLALGLVVFGVEPLETFLTAVVPAESQTGDLARDPLAHDYQTVRRQLAAVLPWLPATWLPVLGVAVVAPVVAGTYRRLETGIDRMLAVLATIVGTLLVLPLEGLYFPLAFFPLVPLLYCLPSGRSRQCLVVGTLLTMVTVTPIGVRALLESGLLGPDLGAALEAVTTPLFYVILPPTVGMWLLVAAGVVWQWRERDQATGATAPA